MARIPPQDAGGHNVVAFLDTLAFAEIGPAMLADSDDGYDVLVGSLPGNLQRFDSYADHPLADGSGPIHVSGNLYSTAAGRYQILLRFWRHYQGLLGLADFSPVNQDRYAIHQLDERRALGHVKAGRFRKAVAKVANVWASLPGAGYNQHEFSLATLAQVYREAGGRFDDADRHWYDEVELEGRDD